MKVKDGFVLREIGDENMVIPVRERADKIHGIIKLSETGAFLWKLLEKEQTEESLLEAMTKEYSVDKEIARKDISEFIEYLEKQNWVE